MCERVIRDQADKPEANPNQHDSITPQHAMQDNSLDRAVSEHFSADSFLCLTSCSLSTTLAEAASANSNQKYVAAQLHALDVHLGKAALLANLGAEGGKY